jgi:VCBS repeat-containing protein
VTVTEGDEDPSSDTGTFTVTVKPANDAPQAEDDSYSVDEDQTLTANASRGVLANDADPDNDALKAVVVDQPTRGTLDLKEDGSFTYTPEKDYNGSDSLTYKASDGTAQSNTATVSITVNAANDPPVANNDPSTGVIYKAKVGQTLNVPVVRGLLANDTDPDNDALVVSDADSSTPSVLDPVTRPTKGRLALKPDGSFAYEPRSNARGKDTFTYMVSDGNGGTDTATVSIKIVR